ncbi:MAG: tyrosine-type recombinase/integrase [Halobacteriaceae archaeon]
MSAEETEIEEDPITYYLEDMTYHGKTDRTKAAYGRVLREFASFLDGRGRRPETADRRDCLAWIHGIRENHAPSTVATYASYVNRFYGYMTQIGAFEGNPMGLVMEELPESVDRDPTRREISLDEMRTFVRSIQHPLDRAVVVILLKTGIRVGELCNLDLRDVSLSMEGPTGSYEALSSRASGRERTLFVESDISRGDRINGEPRTAANKRVRDTQIPIDAELASVLRRWLAIRPDTPSPAEPLFVSTRDAWGQRLTPEMVRSIVSEYARDHGWYDDGGGASSNVTPHYFRHFFTTYLRDRTGDRGIVKYLRGDVADDIIDTYTHNWGDRVREVYETEIYALLSRSVADP